MFRGVHETMAPVRGHDQADLPGAVEARLERERRRRGGSPWAWTTSRS
jgi:hypothetical protein